VKRKWTLCLLTSIFLLLCGVAAQAAAKDVKLSSVTTQEMVVDGMVDKPNVNIIVLDTETNQIIGQAVAKADAKGTFSSKVLFSTPLKEYTTLALNVTDSDDDGNKTTVAYRIVVDCWTKQQTNPQNDPCGWILYGPILADETMG
jgi:hypothetical protein